MSVDLTQFIPSFLEESFEGLELMESSLLNLEQGDDETINSIFRAAHSIKGGAGTFGFNHVTEFTHLVETLLDEMRDGRRNIEADDVELLLESVDCMRLLIEAIRDERECDSEKIAENSKRLEEALAASGSVMSEALTINADDAPTDNSSDIARWQIKFIPEHHLVQTGNDPLLLFNALADLGKVSLEANTKELPTLNDIDAEELYLSWQLTLHSNASEADIREVFEWVEDECELIITKEVQDQPLEAVTEAVTVVNTLEGSSQNEQADLTPPIEAHFAEPTPKNNTDKPVSKSKNDLGSIRVGVDKVDSLINLVGELVITQSMLSELGSDFDLSKVERLNAGLEQLLQNTKELQESVMRIRMLPISFAFNRFPRLVHDLSKKTGKEIELILKGEQTELDKTVMEQIGDPLVHLVRNAVDHGIEPAQVRLAHGKPEKGTIVLDAYHQGGSIVIEISDDGGGIDRQAVFNKALEKGLVDEKTTLTDSQVFDLLFEPGFSTAKEVSDISGRGVGMDVVKKNIQSLGGRIQVESEQGKGSTFRVNLPLTLAILDGQLVRVGKEVYIIPLITIVESLQPQKELINRVSGDMLLYRLREDNVPVIPIYQLFNIPCEFEHIESCLLVVVEADGQKIGLMVDDLLAQQQVVIKSLNDNYQQVQGVSGATILGDGSVAMILDVAGIIEMALTKAQINQQHQSSVQSQITRSISAGVNA
ncbi:chemotaxis protein CheA [Colwellia hornerae]|uniref:Chemotaxis protein CheA n=1 Tax=Colwellia hornerae TaxID=89402 RepID=A0A5C6QH86_9GAMM|nr:chemotaxis protein CheA [Colwellia hornerae]TWX52827.1 chemotaxis protein CheA [Colwellia hornerae]TWX59181.1 chemotaxis protein CheA [Colwellia hornerae]TWX68209.1 chemotaxis protein CheA [Colwellia hornerae]